MTDRFDAEGCVVVIECLPLCVDVIGTDVVDGIDVILDRILECLTTLTEGFYIGN